MLVIQGSLSLPLILNYYQLVQRHVYIPSKKWKSFLNIAFFIDSKYITSVPIQNQSLLTTSKNVIFKKEYFCQVYHIRTAFPQNNKTNAFEKI